jgi:hypothetical protein
VCFNFEYCSHSSLNGFFAAGKIMGGCPFTLPEKDKGENFDDCPLVVVPDDVPDGFQRV